MSAVSTGRNRSGCLTCRGISNHQFASCLQLNETLPLIDKHVKCDEVLPVCSRCKKTGSECKRGLNVRFRHTNFVPFTKNTDRKGDADFFYPTDQVWFTSVIEENFDIVDETPEVAGLYSISDTTSTPSTPFSNLDNPNGSREEDLLIADLTGRHDAAFLPNIGNLNASPSLQPDHVISQILPPYNSPNGSFPTPTATHEGIDILPKYHTASTPILYDQNHTSDTSPNAVSDYGVISPSADGSPYASHYHGERARRTSQLYVPHQLYPFKDRSEARLMRYFVDYLAPWFDLTDYDRHFARVVPQRAANCPMLLNSILAVSARHLSFLGRTDICTFSDFTRYHDRCLQNFIPSLDDSAAVLDENILAATVILRYLEEVDVPLFVSDTQFHLIGTRIFVIAQGDAIIAGGLRQAAFWVALRQEIYMAIVGQRPVQSGFDLPSFDRSFSPADDCAWANRIVMHCADVLRFCFGDDQSNLQDRYEELLEYDLQWLERKPKSFTPTYCRAPNPEKGEVFPEIWYLEQCHVIAMQHHSFCRILLAINHPQLRRLGAGSGKLWRTVQEQIRLEILDLCGTGVCNYEHTPPAMMTASVGIVTCGDRFTNRAEHEAMLNVLIRTEKELGWPTTTAQARLKESWGWID